MQNLPPTSAPRSPFPAPLLRAAAIAALACLTPATLAQSTTNPTLPSPPAAPAARAKPQAHPGWWNDAVFYEVFIRSFADSTKGPLAGDGIGDIQGLIDHLDYLNDGDPKTTTDLGVTAFWLMPVMQSPSYHGYDATDYFKVNPDYGTNDDFKRLIEECHRRGIKVVIDLVLNHHSDQHPWFKRAIDPASPFHDWYIWEGEKPAWKGPWNEEVWHKATALAAAEPAAKRPYYYGIFGGHMPDLNYKNAEVTRQMREVSRFWLSDMHADGFRLDAIRHLIEDGQTQDNTPATHQWLTDFRTFTKGLSPDAFTVGEVWAPSDVASTYVGPELDTVFEFELAQAIIDAVNDQDATKLGATLQKAWDLYPDNQFCTFLTNHDQTRVMTQFLKKSKGDEKAAHEKAALAAAILFTLPGVPFVYYGEELGMTGDKPDPMLRTPMQWSAGPNAGFTTGRPWKPVSAASDRTNVEGEGRDAASLLSVYRQLIQLRLQTPALQRGSLLCKTFEGTDAFAFERQFGDSVCRVLVNFSNSPAPQSELDWVTGRTAPQWRVLDRTIVSPAGVTVIASQTEPRSSLPPHSMLIVREHLHN